MNIFIFLFGIVKISGVDEAPSDSTLQRSASVWPGGGGGNIESTKICCGFFRMYSVLLTDGSVLDPSYELWKQLC